MKLISKILSLFVFLLAVNLHAVPVEEAILTCLMDEYQLDTEQYEIEVLSCRLKVKDVDPEVLRIKPISQKKPLGLYTMIIQVLEGEEVKEASQVRVKIKKFEDVLVVTDKFKRHELLANERTEISRMDVSDLRSQPFSSVEETGGYRVKSSIQKGAIVTRNMLEVIPDIEAGKETTIVYAENGFKITAEGIALQTGSTGDYIKVKNKTSKKILIARIVDANFVAVDP